MKVRDAVRWNTGASVVYAAGMWTMIGYFGYMKYTGRFHQTPEEAKEAVVDNTVVYATPHTKTSIVYKQGFVPYTTRIYNFLRPPGAEEPLDEASRRF